ncbi:MAG: cupin domain-containing protein [Eggerthellaceae bacterium]|nr:cupin domain-containing protein [Eggerthellaceae bacterium]
MPSIEMYTVLEDESCLDALRKINENKKGFLVVIDDNNRVCGTLTDGDIRRAVLAGVDIDASLFYEGVYQSEFTYLFSNQSEDDAIDAFKSNKFEFLPIVDKHMRLKSILTRKQLQFLLMRCEKVSLDNSDFLSIDESLIDFEVFNRPWGIYKTTVLQDHYHSKVLHIRPNEALSLQCHLHRDECWTIVHGKGFVQVGDSERPVGPGDMISIPKGYKHRLTNTSDSELLVVCEVQIGDYFGEDDIVRLEDRYGRDCQSDPDTKQATIAFIPARGGSVSIPLKNIKPICGKPLLYWAAKAANDCAQIDKVIVSTDSELIKEAANNFGLAKLEVFDRGSETATHAASTELAMLEYARNHGFGTMVLIQATSPLLTAQDLEEGFSRFGNPAVDSVLSVVEDKGFYWVESDDGAHPLNYDVFMRPRRQDFDGCYRENGAFYITSRERLLESKNRVSGHLGLSVMPAEAAFEIDEPADWIIVEALLRRQIAIIPDFSKVRIFLTDCDGCLTDGGMYYTESGEKSKRFNARDGMGFQLLREKGIKVGIITGEDSDIVRRRAEKLKVDFLELGCMDKLAATVGICKQEGVALNEVLYIGDDINDVELLLHVGISCVPADAQPEVLSIAQYKAHAQGGKGVIREIAELVASAN